MSNNGDRNISHWTVLAVDDEPDSLEVVMEVLEFYGATVHTASDGLRALEMLVTVQPDLILTDLSMPNLDGWGLLAAVRRDPKLAGIPIVALTAHAMAGDEERAMAAGFTSYITKPISPLSLIEEIMARVPALAQV